MEQYKRHYWIAICDDETDRTGGVQKLPGEADGRYCELWNAQAQYYTS